MKKSFFIILPALFLSLCLTGSALAEGTNVSVTISDHNAAQAPVVVSQQNASTLLPDFEITEVTAKKSESDATVTNYFVSVINKGANFVINTDTPLGLAFRNGSEQNSAENTSYYSVGTVGETFAKDQKMIVGPLLVAVDGVNMIKVIVNPLLTVNEKKFNNNYYQQEVPIGETAIKAFNLKKSSEVVIAPDKPKSTSTAAVAKPKYDLKKEAALVAPSGSVTTKLEALVKELKTVRSNQKMAENMKSYTETLKKQFPKISIAQLYTINNFVTYGTESTAKLNAKERFALVTAYVKANKKLPNSEADWAKLLALKK